MKQLNSTINYNLHYAQSLVDMMPHVFTRATVQNGEITLYANQEAVLEGLTFLRYHTSCRYEVLVDIVGVDYPEREERFEVIYLLSSITYNARIQVKVNVDERTPLMSVSSLYSSAAWYERETFDMFGVFFTNHPDLRRLLTDYGFNGHPLRKDFPLTGYTEIRYDEAEKRLVTEDVELAQEYRSFDFSSQWDQQYSPEVVGYSQESLEDSKSS